MWTFGFAGLTVKILGPHCIYQHTSVLPEVSGVWIRHYQINLMNMALLTKYAVISKFR